MKTIEKATKTKQTNQQTNQLNKKNITVSLLSPYLTSVHTTYKNALLDLGYQIKIEHNLGIDNDSLVSSISLTSIEQIIDSMMTQQGQPCDVFLIVCSAFNITKFGFLERLEKKYPTTWFITSNQALLWYTLQKSLPSILNHKIKNIVGYGKLFS